MITEIKDEEVELVSGAGAFRTLGNWVGEAVNEMEEHPVGAMFGVGGIVIAHYLNPH